MYLKLLCLFGALVPVQAFHSSPLELAVPQLRQIKQRNAAAHAKRDQVAVEYPAYNLSVPVDHFHNESRYEPHSDEEFNLRYWFDDTHYKEGGPVIVIAAGETTGTARFPFLSQGIVTQLAKAYHGIGVILEHRYYGESFPKGDLNRESIRFLTTEQAVADYAYFASNVVFPGLEHVDLSPENTPWLAYGGSYAGAFVAFLRKLYPDIYWGAVSSSGVTEAIIDYWGYYEPIRQYAPSDCIRGQQVFIDIIDRTLIDHAGNQTLNAILKRTFGAYTDLSDTQFASVLSVGLDEFQGRNWDQATGAPGFQQFCKLITNPKYVYNDTAIIEPLKLLVGIAGYSWSNTSFFNGLLNHVAYLKHEVFSPYTPEEEPTSLDTLPKNEGISWGYQVCTEWGYFTTGSGVPDNIQPLISRVLDVAALNTSCAERYGIETPPDVDRINKHGGFNFSYPRVAIIDGLADPWREATPHADVAPERESTDEEPFILIDIPADEVWDGIRGAVHHWDQNGLPEGASSERIPQAILDVQKEVHRFIGVWLEEWKKRDASLPVISRHRQRPL